MLTRLLMLGPLLSLLLSGCDSPGSDVPENKAAAECCDIWTQPSEDSQCCADTTWQAPGEGACDGLGGSGEVWQRDACCDLENRPPALEPGLCCADGQWIGNSGGGDASACDENGGLCQVCEAAA